MYVDPEGELFFLPPVILAAAGYLGTGFSAGVLAAEGINLVRGRTSPVDAAKAAVIGVCTNAAARTVAGIGVQAAVRSGALKKAQSALDDFFDLPRKQRKKTATVSAGTNPKTGKTAVGKSDPTKCNGAGCAERDVANQVGGDDKDIIFTKARRGGKESKEIPICPHCQKDFGRDQFPPGTKFD